MPDAQPPSFLRSRVLKAKAAAATVAQVAQPKPADQPATPTTTKARKPKNQPVAVTARKGDKMSPIEGCDQKDAKNSSTSTRRAAVVDAAAVRRVFERNGNCDPEAMAQALPIAPAVFAAILDGAQVRGPSGHVDRMTLFRILGLPWYSNANRQHIGGGELDVAAANRLSNALSRIERRLGGHETVTVDAEIVEERPAQAVIEG